MSRLAAARFHSRIVVNYQGGMRRSRSSNVSIADKPVTIDVPNERDRTIFSILSYHRFLPSNWLLHHFPTARRSVGT
ncbi:MAG: hypothetical protein AB7V13_10930, partial [Pseudorhodoplanes sp.]